MKLGPKNDKGRAGSSKLSCADLTAAQTELAAQFKLVGEMGFEPTTGRLSGATEYKPAALPLSYSPAISHRIAAGLKCVSGVFESRV